MIIIKDGDLLNATEDIIAHQTNCQGVMGSGVALQIKRKYPIVFELYKTFCREFADKTNMLLGKIQVVNCNNVLIANLFGQDRFGRDKQYTNYEALKQAFTELLYLAKMENKTVAMPYNIGCGTAGGNWSIVFQMLSDISDETGCDVVLYRIT